MEEVKNPSIIHEADFTHRIHTEVEPWCAQTLHRGRITSYDGKLLRYYYAMNPDAAGTIVVVHGFCEFIGKYRELLYTFYHAGYNVFFYEQRGHGDSQRETKHEGFIYVKSFDQYIEDLKWFMDKKVLPTVGMKKTAAQLEQHPLFLFAHSMGGAVGTYFLEEYPEYFDAAVLSSPMHRMFTGNLKSWQIRLLSSVANLLRMGKKPAPGQGGFDPNEAYETSCSLSPARFAYVLEQRRSHPQYQMGGATFSWVGSGVRTGEKILENAGKIDIPVLILQAEHDDLVDIKAHEEFAEKAGNVRIVRFDGAKHEIMNGTDEMVDRFYQEIFSFYRKQADRLS